MAISALLGYFWLMYICQLSHQNYSPIGLLMDEELQRSRPWSSQSVMYNAIQLAVRNLAQSYPNLRVYWSSSSRLSTRSELENIMESSTTLILLTSCENADLIIRHINGSLMRTAFPTLRLDASFCSKALVIPELTQHVTLYNLPDNQVSRVLTASLASFTDIDKQETILDINYAQEAHPTIHRWSPSSIKHVARYLKGHTLNVSTIHRIPFVRILQDNGEVHYGGVCFEIIHALQSKYSFNYNVRIPEDKSYGKLQTNGSWNGMVRMVIDHVVDMGVAQFTMEYNRKTAVDFSTSFHEEPTALLIPPPRQDSKTFACAKPFRLEVWLLLILVLIILPPLLWFHHRVLWTVNKRYRLPTMSQEFFFVFGVISTQSGQDVVPGLAPRFLAAVWCLASVVIVYVYMGSLMSFLTIIKLRPIVNSLEELATSKELTWAVLKATALDGLFTEAKDGVYSIIGSEILRRPATHYVNIDEDGLRKVLTGQFAYIKEKSYLDNVMGEDFAETQHCRLSLAKQEFFKANFGFILPKRSFLNMFNTDIMRMVEAGLPGFWIDRQRKFNPCSKIPLASQGEGVQSLVLDDLQSAFVVLGTGAAAAFLVYILEWMYFRYGKCRSYYSRRKAL